MGAAEGLGVVAVGEVRCAVLAGESFIVVVFHVDKLWRKQAVVEVGRTVVGHPAHEAAPFLGVGALQLAVEHAVGEVGGAIAQVAEEAAMRAVAVG